MRFIKLLFLQVYLVNVGNTLVILMNTFINLVLLYCYYNCYFKEPDPFNNKVHGICRKNCTRGVSAPKPKNLHIADLLEEYELWAVQF